MGIAINFCRNLFLLASFAGYIVPRCRSSGSKIMDYKYDAIRYIFGRSLIFYLFSFFFFNLFI
jgi:hypothetical protein